MQLLIQDKVLNDMVGKDGKEKEEKREKELKDRKSGKKKGQMKSQNNEGVILFYRGLSDTIKG